MRRRLLLLAIVSTLALAACSDTAGTDPTDGAATMPTSDTSGTTSGATEDTSGMAADPETMADLQAQLDEFSDAVAQSQAAQDLETSWNTLSAELAASVAAISEDGTVAREEIESGLEDFEERLDELDVEESVRSAWESLRSQLEQVMATS